MVTLYKTIYLLKRIQNKNVHNVHLTEYGAEGQLQKQHKSIKEEKHMKANQTKVKKKGRTVRAFKRDLSLWLFCVPGVVLTFIFSYIPMYGIQRDYEKKSVNKILL